MFSEMRLQGMPLCLLCPQLPLEPPRHEYLLKQAAISGFHPHGSRRECYAHKGPPSTTPQKMDFQLILLIQLKFHFYMCSFVCFAEYIINFMTTCPFHPEICMCIVLAGPCSTHRQLYQLERQFPRRRKETQTTEYLWKTVINFLFLFFLKLISVLRKQLVLSYVASQTLGSIPSNHKNI